MLVTLPSPHPGPATRPSTPEVLSTREHALTFYSVVVFTLDSHLSLSRSLGTHQHLYRAFHYFILKHNMHQMVTQ
jgi:hypothetical protein